MKYFATIMLAVLLICLTAACALADSCSLSPDGAHHFGVWVTLEPANCLKTGTAERECAFCGKKETRTVDKTEHAWGEWTVDIEATCQRAGKAVRTCTVCGRQLSLTSTKTDHLWSEWTVTREATCKQDGSQTRACVYCGKTQTQKIKKHHTYGDWTVTREATCSKKGSRVRTCLICGDEDKESIRQDPDAHSVSDWTTLEEPDCLTPGRREGRCALCKKKVREDIPALGHDYGPYTVITPAQAMMPGVRERTCARCQYVDRAVYEPDACCQISVRMDGNGNTVTAVRLCAEHAALFGPDGDRTSWENALTSEYQTLIDRTQADSALVEADRDSYFAQLKTLDALSARYLTPDAAREKTAGLLMLETARLCAVNGGLSPALPALSDGDAPPAPDACLSVLAPAQDGFTLSESFCARHSHIDRLTAEALKAGPDDRGLAAALDTQEGLWRAAVTELYFGSLPDVDRDMAGADLSALTAFARARRSLLDALFDHPAASAGAGAALLKARVLILEGSGR